MPASEVFQRAEVKDVKAWPGLNPRIHHRPIRVTIEKCLMQIKEKETINVSDRTCILRHLYE